MRKLGLIISFWLAITAIPTHGLALGLGEIEISSFLNQPLKAEIEVISARPGEIDDLLVSLASRDAFTRAGLSRPRHLLELRFAVVKNAEGDKATIQVTTKVAIKEPFLNFLIEADWSKGRVLREFTVLLDPPFFADTAPETSAQPSQSESTASVSDSEGLTQPRSSTTTQQTSTEPIALAGESNSGSLIAQPDYSEDTEEDLIEGDVLVVKGNTLWGIASRFKDATHSMGQVMLAIQRANPGAFGNKNINNLKVGSVLRAPSTDEMDLLSKQQAYAQVLEQNGLWDDYVARIRGRTTSAALSSSTAGTVKKEADSSTSNLSLLTPGTGDSDTAGLQNDSDEANKLRTQLAMAEERLDASKIENRELGSRIAELEARLSKFEELQKMVQIEDDSLSQLQANQAQQELTASETLTEEMKSADEEALLEELLSDGSTVAGPALETESSTVVESVTEPLESSDTLEDSTAEIAEQQATVKPLPAPVIISEPVPESSSMLDGILPRDVVALIPSVDSILQDPIILGALGGIILLLIALVFLKRRKSSEDDGLIEEEFEGLTSDDDLTPIHLADETVDETNINAPTAVDLVPIVEHEEEEEDEDEFSKTAVLAHVDVPETDTEAEVGQDDVLNEVDVYLAYGLYDNAEELLNQNLDSDPDRADYRAKLLDTYFATKNADAFVKQAETLKSMGNVGSRYWDRVVVMGYELAPDNALFSGGRDSDLSAADLQIAKPEVADFDLGADDDDTNFSNTDFNLGEDADDLSQTQAIGATQAGLGVLSETQEMADLDNLLDLDTTVDDTRIRGEEDFADSLEDLPDDIGELEFSFDGEDSSAEDELESLAEEDGGVDFELPDELDLSDDAATDFLVDDSQNLEQELSTETEVSEATDFLVDDSLDFEEELSTEDNDPTDIIDLPETDPTDIDIIESAESDPTDIIDLPETYPTDIIDLQDPDPTDIIDLPETYPTDIIDLPDDLAELEESSDSSETDTRDVEVTAQVDVTAVIPPEDIPASRQDSIELGMEDTSSMQVASEGTHNDTMLDLDNLDDVDTFEIEDEDQGPDIVLEQDIDDADMPVLEIAEDFEIDEDDESLDFEDAAMMDVDVTSEGTKTGTFAPGDFEDPDESKSAESYDDVDFDDIEDLMLPDDVDEVSTKLDLARAFIDMGDLEGARGSLQEVVHEGTAEQKAEATGLLDKI